jgi:hypothetical protein
MAYKRKQVQSRIPQRQAKQSESRYSTVDPVGTEDGKEQAKLSEQLNAPQREAVAAQFRAEAGVRQALTENFKPLHAESQAVAARVEQAFAKFNPSTLSAEELERRHHVAPGTDPGKALESIIKRGVHALRSANTKRGLTVRNSAELNKLVKKGADSPNGTVELGPLFEFIRQLGAGPVTRPEPSATPYQAAAEAEAILNSVGNSGGAAVTNQQEDRAAEDGGVDELVRNNVNLQMNSATPPEGELIFGKIPNSADDDKAQKTILQTFELRQGPTDVTAYHDFHTLQIAFAHVWTSIFDGQLTSLGRDLYREYVRLKDFSGSDAPDFEVGTYADLKRLIDEVKQLSQFVDNELPAGLRPQGGDQTSTGGSTITPEDVGRGVGAALTGGASLFIEWAINELVQIGNHPVRVEWKDFPLKLQESAGDIIELLPPEQNAVPRGTVEIVLKTDANSFKKQIIFQQWDQDTQRPIYSDGLLNFRGGGVNVTDSIPLNTTQMEFGTLKFLSEDKFVNNIAVGRYVLGNLAEKLTDGTRVTFRWRGVR